MLLGRTVSAAEGCVVSSSAHWLLIAKVTESTAQVIIAYFRRPIWFFPCNLGPHCLKRLVFSSLNGADNSSCHPLSPNQELGNSQKLSVTLQSIVLHTHVYVYLTAPGLRCGMQGLQFSLRHVGSLVAACGIQF